ncbi:hypothetical protein MKX08_003473, partial [Trichoderma sp. CBMAI-0020]
TFESKEIPVNSNMLSNIRAVAWSSLLSVALAQTANLQFFSQDTACSTGLFAQCTNLPPDQCCFLVGLATCANWQSANGVNGVAHWFLANSQNPCGILIISALNNEDCTPVGPDVFGWKEEDGATWLLHQKDNTAVFDQVTEAIAKNSSDQQIGDLIKEHGVRD